MIFIRLIIAVVFCLLLCYYGMVVAQSVGVLEFTDSEVKMKGLIPFYYWFKKTKTKQKKTSKK